MILDKSYACVETYLHIMLSIRKNYKNVMKYKSDLSKTVIVIISMLDA